MRQVDADDGRQELRREAHCQGQGEEKGIHYRAGQVDVDGEDGDHQEQRHFQEQIAKMLHTQLELGLGRLIFSRCETAPNSVSFPVWTTRAVAVPLTTLVPKKRLLLRPDSSVSSGSTPGSLFRGKGLACERCLIDKEIL